MEETKRRKIESLVFAAGLFLASVLLVYRGGIKSIPEAVLIIFPVFGAALVIFSVNSFAARLCALLLLWVPQIVFLKTGDYTALFLPVVSLLFAASSIDSVRVNKNKKLAVAALILSVCFFLAGVIYNASQFALRRYFSGRWNKLIVLLILFALLFIHLRSIRIKTYKNQSDEKTASRYARILFAIAIADIALGMETLFQLSWKVFTIHPVYCTAWLLFFVGIIRYQIPQVIWVKKDLKLE